MLIRGQDIGDTLMNKIASPLGTYFVVCLKIICFFMKVRVTETRKHTDTNLPAGSFPSGHSTVAQLPNPYFGSSGIPYGCWFMFQLLYFTYCSCLWLGEAVEDDSSP